jgi:beta-keto acid cleavage enzyme
MQMAMALILGIHVRVGIEDNIWRVKGERFTTLQQVEQMVRLAEAFGRKVATAEEARAIMKIGTWYDSPEQTLLHLGLPPNRAWRAGLLGVGDQRQARAGRGGVGFASDGVLSGRRG